MAIRVGFVGAGFAAREHYARLRDREEVEVVAVCDIAAERAQEFAERVGAPAYTSVERMLRAVVPDAVWVCVPPRAHGALELRLVEVGCALWIEPPLALATRTVNALGLAFKRAGVPVCVASPWRYSSAFERAKRLLSGKGALVPALVHGLWSQREPAPAWRRDDATSGGIWLESAWPLLDAARILCGEPHRVSASGTSYASQLDNHAGDIGAMWCEFSGGAAGSFGAVRVGPQAARLELVTPQGIARLEGLGTPRIAFTWETDGETLRVDPTEDALALAHEAFLRAVAHGKRLDLRATYADAAKTQNWAFAVNRALKSRKPIRLAAK